MEPKRDIRIGDVVLRRQPPVVGFWCSPPTAAKSTRTRCVYDNDACGDGSTVCPLCFFPFCDSHLKRHTRRFECPVDVWLTFNERRRRWYQRVERNPRAKPKVDVAFPDEAGDG
jgi:hypothetical protein